MKLPLDQVNHFMSRIPLDEDQCSLTLHAGKIQVTSVSLSAVCNLPNDPMYDVELLPSLFTYRELLWQPDLPKNPEVLLTGIRILRSFCHETIESWAIEKEKSTNIYAQLLDGIALASLTTEEFLIKRKEKIDIQRAISDLRKEVFPIIRFFVEHPANKPDYRLDAEKRLDFAVKILLSQFPVRYSQLNDPYWEVIMSDDNK